MSNDNIVPIHRQTQLANMPEPSYPTQRLWFNSPHQRARFRERGIPPMMMVTSHTDRFMIRQARHFMHQLLKYEKLTPQNARRIVMWLLFAGMIGGHNYKWQAVNEDEVR